MGNAVLTADKGIDPTLCKSQSAFMIPNISCNAGLNRKWVQSNTFLHPLLGRRPMLKSSSFYENSSNDSSQNGFDHICIFAYQPKSSEELRLAPHDRLKLIDIT
ncbi:hypothetical protein Ciccas_008858 [Cichlidogyrus casuarinus]|uniref:Uncharacterized protein n=1 Tax=Cichlidogyrus casuarinus TaxID=1844966 RepID=A0ABD2PZA7_9PLAT